MLQLRQLLDLKLEEDVRSRLGQLPDDLKKVYDELYITIHSQPDSAPIIAERAFKWVMCSFRPSTSRELVVAICQETSTD